jgi:chromosome segregation ATPase
MTTEDTTVPADEQIAPLEADEQAASESGESAPQPTEREKELERRLRQQGQQLADLKRTNTQLSSDLTRINSTVTLLGENLTAQQREQDQRRQQQAQAYLDSLPEPQRLREEVRLANERVARLETTLSTRNAATARPSVVAPPPAQETPEQYFRRRGNEIIAEAGETYGVTLDRTALESLEESDWDDERSFTRAINKLAARMSNGEEISVPAKKTPSKPETPAEMEARITESVKRSIGISSPASPRAAGSGRRGAAPTSEDVAKTMETYDSRKGPKANLAKLREQRAQMG